MQTGDSPREIHPKGLKYPNDPKPWESVKRYDGPGSDPHYNKALKQDIDVPHVHDPYCPGGIRPALPGEIPK